MSAPQRAEQSSPKKKFLHARAQGQPRRGRSRRLAPGVRRDARRALGQRRRQASGRNARPHPRATSRESAGRSRALPPSGTRASGALCAARAAREARARARREQRRARARRPRPEPAPSSTMLCPARGKTRTNERQTEPQAAGGEHGPAEAQRPGATRRSAPASAAAQVRQARHASSPCLRPSSCRVSV